MANFVAAILEVAGDESIEAIVLSQDSYRFPADSSRHIDDGMLNRLLSWDEAKPLLNYEYDDGFGGEDCHAFYAWTQTRVLFVHEYDGSTSVVSVPRNPRDASPGMI